jgi:hypothetical protein
VVRELPAIGRRGAAGEALRIEAVADASETDHDLWETGALLPGPGRDPTADPGQKKRLLSLALDGLRYRP